MSKRLIGIAAGVVTLAAAGWMINSGGDEQSASLDDRPQVEGLESSKAAVRPKAPELNWTRAPLPEQRPVVQAKTQKAKTARPNFRLVQRQRLPGAPVAAVSAAERERAKREINKLRPGADTPWIQNLSGPDANLSLRNRGGEDRSCIGSACEYMKDPDFNVAGVVLDTQRFGLKDEGLLQGQLAQGDGKKTPFVYVE